MADTGKNSMEDDNIKLSETENVKCPSCGANMTFDPKSGKLKCAHCDTIVDINPQQTAQEQDYNNRKSNQWPEGFVESYRCENCGAVTVLDKNEISSSCPFCGAAQVIKVDEMPGIRPTSIIPFAFTREESKKYYLTWIKKRWYAPRKLKQSFVADKIQGVYIPCWTYDSNTSSEYDGKLGERYTVTVGSGKSRHTETRIRWFYVSGIYDKFFDDIAIEDSSYIDQKRYNKIAPYDTNNSLKFDSRFMAGFSAEKYITGVEECFEKAKAVMDSCIRSDILNKYKADEVSYLNVKTTHTKTTYKYVILPLWVCAYKYKEKQYNFFVNGKTGRTNGTYPKSALKILLTVLGGLALAALIIWLALK